MHKNFKEVHSIDSSNLNIINFKKLLNDPLKFKE